MLVLQMGGMTVNDVEVRSLVGEYQESLIGPQSRKTLGNDIQAGPGLNQYGYSKGQEYSLLDGMSTEVLARVQDRMAALGMGEGFLPGRKDKRTVEAFSELLWMANAEGTSWAVQLRELERQKEEMGDDWIWDADGEGSERAPFVAPAYLAPDYATLAQDVKSQMRQVLGRDPDDSEIAQLTAELDGWYKGAYDEEVAAMRSEYDAGVEADELDQAQAAGEFRTVDPVARFKENFEKKFSSEIDFVEDRDDTGEDQQVTRAGIDTISALAYSFFGSLLLAALLAAVVAAVARRLDLRNESAVLLLLGGVLLLIDGALGLWSLTFGGGKTYEDNGASYQRG